MITRQTQPAPAPLEAHIGFWLRFVSNHVSARFQQHMAAKGVTVSEWVALRSLWSQTDATHAALIEALGMTKGATSKVISRLEEKGLVERALADGRAREQSLRLTVAGKKLVPKLAALADANDAHFFAHLPATERVALTKIMKDLVKHHQLKEFPTV
ncbi:MarR family transcriptional regulator [Ahniella affigens]|uniref:MarR family transcriptional regulator n=1 Tax=Ahniella affigens TaxID=2021234 RepID=A0A2P1PQ78_9GAMM|nr:MarR family winged helix-turn-helix transcriptional regulator [Ahniella affigens]AVP96994.1 MarR family transcriptional regulator [Ahniella affigens]